MNWLKTLWDKLVRKTSVSTTLVVVEEDDSEEIGNIFRDICTDAGVLLKDLRKHDMIAIFEKWYTGDVDEESIRQSISLFMKEQGGAINAKLNGKF